MPLGLRAGCGHARSTPSPRPLRIGFALLCATVALCVAPAAGAARATPAAASSTLSLVLPLASNTAGLARFATEVSTPGTRLYHHYRSIAWLSAHFGASPASERRVVAYLRGEGATRVRIDHTGLFVDATLKTVRAEALFGTSLRLHAARAGDYVTPAAAPRIPAALTGAVTGVIGLDTQPVVTAAGPARTGTVSTARAGRAQTAFSSLAAAIIRPASPEDPADPTSSYMGVTGTPSGCPAGEAAGGFTPSQYLSAYNYGALQSAGTLGQGERVALIEIDGFTGSDITHFAACFGLHVPKIVSFRTDAEVPRDGLAPGGESTLDLEVLTAAAPDLSQIDVYQSGPTVADVDEALTSPLQNSGYKPEVISASLGLCEPEVHFAIGIAGLRNTEAALEEAAASGISVLAASGDDGSSDCLASNSADSLPLPELAVNFPASSPYVTAVGGTNLTLAPGTNAIEIQQVWNDASDQPGSAGGGGVSTLFTRPAYQDGVATAGSRELPDVAMLADIAPGYDVYCTATSDCLTSQAASPWGAFGGTSAATPLLAGGLALIDEQLRQHKKQSLGLINPLLYALGKNSTENPLVFSDVTVGSNDVGPYIRASAAPIGCCSAAPGFDEASGWGSVNLGNLATAALAAKPAIVNIAELLPRPQSPVSRGALYDTVTCSGPSLLGALAKVRIGAARPFTVYSGIYHLTREGTKLIKIPFREAELTRLRAGLRRHLRITATVVGAILDPAGNVERSTPAETLSITR
jgi:subtilase family serine protease